MRIRTRLTIRAPRGVIWRHIVDPALIARRAPGVESFEWIAGHPEQAGSQLRVVRREDAGRSLMETTVVRADPPSRLESRSVMSSLEPPAGADGRRTLHPKRYEIAERWDLAPSGPDRTAVDVALVVRFEGVWRLLGWLARREVRRRAAESILALEAAVAPPAAE